MTEATMAIETPTAALDADFAKLMEDLGVKGSNVPYAEEVSEIIAHDTMASRLEHQATEEDQHEADYKGLMESAREAAKQARARAAQHRLEAGRVLVRMKANLGSKAAVYAWAADHCGISKATARNWYELADDPKAAERRKENNRKRMAKKRAEEMADAGSTETGATRPEEPAPAAPIKSGKKSARLALLEEVSDLFHRVVGEMSEAELRKQRDYLKSMLAKKEAA